MGGTSGSGAFSNSRSAADLRDAVRRAEDKTNDAAFDAKVSGMLGDLLGAYNGRDAETARERLEAVKATLQESIDGSFDQFFGGSVAKHTYVDGLSDVDSLILINDTALEGKTPKQVLSRITATLKLPFIGPITVFHLAKNLGLDVAKPDRHVARAAAQFGFADAAHLCGEVARLTGEPKKVIDIVFWRYLADSAPNLEMQTL